MKKLLCILSLALCVVCLPVDGQAQKRNSAVVQKEKQEANKKVKQTQKQIEANKKKISSSLNQLNAIKAEIAVNNKEIGKIQTEINHVDRRIRHAQDTIRQIQADIKRIKQSSAQSLREGRTRRQSLSSLAMIFSSSSFSQAVKRAGYLQQLDRSRAKKAKTLQAKLAILDVKKSDLESLRKERGENLDAMQQERAKLEANQSESNKIVGQLRKEGKALERELNERKKKAAALDRELDKIIQEEARRAAEEARKEEARKAAEAKKAESQKKTPTAPTAPTTTKPQSAASSQSTASAPTSASASTPFAQMKGKLPAPVQGKYTIVGRFGRSKHADLSKVEVENAGIDIQAQKGANALAVHSGVVSSIFHLDGYHNIVMLRHGEYLTIYANIDKLLVKKGDKVVAGQSLGAVYSDPNDGGRTILHFEVRKEREKLNPADWLKQ